MDARDYRVAYGSDLDADVSEPRYRSVEAWREREAAAAQDERDERQRRDSRSMSAHRNRVQAKRGRRA